MGIRRARMGTYQKVRVWFGLGRVLFNARVNIPGYNLPVDCG